MLAVTVLVVRLVYLQVLRHDYFTELSQGNRIRIDPLPPPRGLIYDRNGVALALNRPAYQLEVIREQTPDIDDTLRRLVALGLLPSEDLERTKRAINARRPFDAVPIRLQLSEEELTLFDLLIKPDVRLNKDEERRVKEIARALLETLKREKLVLDWRKKAQARAGVQVAIEEGLNELPDPYDVDLYQQKIGAVYQHIYENYFGAGQSTYSRAA